MGEKKSKVFVGMSGGIDSSVSAALLKRDGHDVVGVFIKVWQADFLPCTWREERRDAMRVAAHLGIPLITLDLEKEYKQEVVDYMIREYGVGRVPNPDVMCNKYVKFGAFLKFAQMHGADFIATGHYARVAHSEGGYQLLVGVDEGKDQTYFLWTLTQKELARTLFPIGHMQKNEVRMLGKKLGLPNAEKKDSQGLCFMGMVDMKDFLKHYLHTEIGNVLNVRGDIIGTHEGSMLYTIGQRHGFVTEKHSADQPPLFVINKDLLQNTITVGERIPLSIERDYADIVLTQVNIIPVQHDEQIFENFYARIRYRGKQYKAKWISRESQIIHIALNGQDEYIAPGQSVVFYVGDECLGGGVICA